MPQQPPVRSTPRTPGTPRTQAPARRGTLADSMALLTDVMDHSLDEGYAEAAARRAAVAEAGTGTGTSPPRSRLPGVLRGKLGLAVGLVLAALIITVGAAQARVAAPEAAKERQELIDRIETGTRAADRLEDRVDALRGEVRARQRAALKDDGTGRGDLTELLSGATAVHGPGVRLVVDDAKATETGSGSPRESADFADAGRVRDRDLQRVVNGLWEAGAEAVSINDRRLTALSAIRAAGDAVLVDNRPLVPPYTVLAVGDGDTLSARFQNGTEGFYLEALQRKFGIRTSISVQDDLRLPAAPSVAVRLARPLDPSAAPTPKKGTS